MTKNYDLIIIGGGPAGLTAGIYAKRFGLSACIIVKESGGLMATAPMLENWPGEKAITGLDLYTRMEAQASELKIDLEYDEVESIKKGKDGTFSVKTIANELKSKALILAMGTKHRHLGVPGEEEYSGKGVSYCATCDAPMFAGKVVAVVGGGDSAAKTAMMLCEHASKVYLLYRGENLRCDQLNKDSVCGNRKITVLYSTNITAIQGEKMVKGITLDKAFEGSKELAVDGIFVSVGQLPQSELAVALGVNVNEKAEIIIDRWGKTSMDGVYAAGDVTDFGFKQVVTAAAQGATAASKVYDYISKAAAK